jgi:hypothetical protein
MRSNTTLANRCHRRHGKWLLLPPPGPVDERPASRRGSRNDDPAVGGCQTLASAAIDRASRHYSGDIPFTPRSNIGVRRLLDRLAAAFSDRPAPAA